MRDGALLRRHARRVGIGGALLAACLLVTIASAHPGAGIVVDRQGRVYFEYLHTTSDDRRAWVPRVRKLSPDGRVAVVAAVERP
jgi:hypothetical protein